MPFCEYPITFKMSSEKKVRDNDIGHANLFEICSWYDFFYGLLAWPWYFEAMETFAYHYEFILAVLIEEIIAET